jgi:imidazolonepropionase-like amidohydrolase
MARVILTNAHLIPGDGPAQPKATVILNGNRIEQVLTKEVTPSPGDRMVDLGGRSVMPGLITSHHHAGYHNIGKHPLPIGFEAPPAYLTLVGARNMERLLHCGFTGAIGAGNGFAMDASLKKAIDDGVIQGPRFLPSGRGLGATGFSLDHQQPWFWHAPAIDVRVCDGADGFRLGVRQEIKEGAEMIKLYVTGGHLSITPGTRAEITRAEMAAAIDAAHGHGAKIRAHVSNPDSILDAIELGIDVIDHGDFLNEAGIDAMAKAGVFFVPSLRLATEALRGGWYQGVSGEMSRELDHMRGLLSRVIEAGVKMVIGDDYGVVVLEHGRQAQELSFYVRELGVPAEDVIRWATRNGAELLGRGDDLGTIEPGKLADVLVVDGNPLEDMSVLDDSSNLLAIIKDGVFMKDQLSSLPARAKRSQAA